MDRRLFLKAASAAGAVGWILPRSGNAQVSSASTSYASAVPFVMDPALNGITPADLTVLFRQAPATAAQQAALYPQSVASGDPRTDGAVLWTRVEPTLRSAPSGDMLAWQIAGPPCGSGQIGQRPFPRL